MARGFSIYGCNVGCPYEGDRGQQTFLILKFLLHNEDIVCLFFSKEDIRCVEIIPIMNLRYNHFDGVFLMPYITQLYQLYDATAVVLFFYVVL